MGIFIYQKVPNFAYGLKIRFYLCVMFIMLVYNSVCRFSLFVANCLAGAVVLVVVRSIVIGSFDCYYCFIAYKYAKTLRTFKKRTFAVIYCINNKYTFIH